MGTATERPPAPTGLPEVAGVEHRWVQAGGVRLHVAEAGEGSPLLLVHGWPQHWYQWRHLVGPLSERYRLLCPDLRGLGWSEAPPTGYDKETLATDLVALLDALDLDAVQVIAHDWGAWATMLACMRRPERFRRHLALGIVPPWPRVTPGALLGLWRFWYQAALASPVLGERLLRSSPAFVERIMLRSERAGTWTAEERAAFSELLRDHDRARASVLYYRTFLVREMLPVALGRYKDHRLRVPTRLVLGTEDFALSPGLIDVEDRHGTSIELVLAEGVGHFIAEERPDLVLDHALDFLEGR
jgi:pimeloyl-ACP methyl ester carboxylesterase